MTVKKTRSIGLKQILVAAVEAAGGMPEAMATLGKTYKGTASFTTENDQTQDFYSEESPTAPEESVVTEAGLKQLKWNLMEWDNAALIKLFGGSEKDVDVVIKDDEGVEKTYSVKKYVASKDTVTIELSVRAISRYNVVIDVPRAQVIARFVWNMTQTEIAQIEITAKALAPFGADDGPYEIYKLGAPKP